MSISDIACNKTAYVYLSVENVKPTATAFVASLYYSPGREDTKDKYPKVLYCQFCIYTYPITLNQKTTK